MSSVFEEVRAEGMAEGKAVGMAEGMAEGKAEAKDLLSKLFIMLEKDNRVSDYSKAVKDSKYMDQLLKEYGLA